MCVQNTATLCLYFRDPRTPQKNQAGISQGERLHNSDGSVNANGGNSGDDESYVLVVVVLLSRLIVLFVGGHDIDGDDLMELMVMIMVVLVVMMI